MVGLSQSNFHINVRSSPSRMQHINENSDPREERRMEATVRGQLLSEVRLDVYKAFNSSALKGNESQHWTTITQILLGLHALSAVWSQEKTDKQRTYRTVFCISHSLLVNGVSRWVIYEHLTHLIQTLFCIDDVMSFGHHVVLFSVLCILFTLNIKTHLHMHLEWPVVIISHFIIYGTKGHYIFYTKSQFNLQSRISAMFTACILRKSPCICYSHEQVQSIEW